MALACSCLIASFSATSFCWLASNSLTLAFSWLNFWPTACEVCLALCKFWFKVTISASLTLSWLSKPLFSLFNSTNLPLMFLYSIVSWLIFVFRPLFSFWSFIISSGLIFWCFSMSCLARSLQTLLSAFKAASSALLLSSFSCKTLSFSCIGSRIVCCSLNFVSKSTNFTFRPSLSSLRILLESFKAGMVCAFSKSWEYLADGKSSWLALVWALFNAFWVSFNWFWMDSHWAFMRMDSAWATSNCPAKMPFSLRKYFVISIIWSIDLASVSENDWLKFKAEAEVSCPLSPDLSCNDAIWVVTLESCSWSNAFSFSTVSNCSCKPAYWVLKLVSVALASLTASLRVPSAIVLDCSSSVILVSLVLIVSLRSLITLAVSACDTSSVSYRFWTVCNWIDCSAMDCSIWDWRLWASWSCSFNEAMVCSRCWTLAAPPSNAWRPWYVWVSKSFNWDSKPSILATSCFSLFSDVTLRSSYCDFNSWAVSLHSDICFSEESAMLLYWFTFWRALFKCSFKVSTSFFKALTWLCKSTTFSLSTTPESRIKIRKKIFWKFPPHNSWVNTYLYWHQVA